MDPLRGRVLEEIVATERSFVESLRTCIAVFVGPLEASLGCRASEVDGALGALLKEKLAGLEVPVVRSPGQRGVLHDAALLDVRAFVDEELAAGGVAVAGGEEHGGIAAVVSLVEGSALRRQKRRRERVRRRRQSTRSRVRELSFDSVRSLGLRRL